MTILAIESSCDETGCAVATSLSGRIKIVSSTIASSLLIQSKHGGVIPEQAAREQLKSIIPIIDEALTQAQISHEGIDAIAVVEGPGLIGSLLVGVETAKTLALIWNKPLISVNHLLAHFYANFIDLGNNSVPNFPFLGLLVSGGHTDLVLCKDHDQIEYLGGTRDDAAGECFDKCARLMGLPYPGGPVISKLAETGDPKAFKLPRPMIGSKDLELSFSGLKTAVATLIEHTAVTDLNRNDLAASIQQAIIDCLVTKTLQALKQTGVNQLVVAGGVAANQKLITDLKIALKSMDEKIDFYSPPVEYCTDNAAMVAARAFFEKPVKDIFSLQANPNLSLRN